MWAKEVEAPMIHVGHIDFADNLVTSEIVTRTRASDLQVALNADVGGPTSEGMAGGRSRAQLLDEENPNPDGPPHHEMTWRVVFAHSLVGRSGGIDAPLFGINTAEAVLVTMMPSLSASAVLGALEAIQRTAYFLREREGKYYASDEPSVNRALADIREGITASRAKDLVIAASRKVIGPGNGLFDIHEDVTGPEHMPEALARPALGVVRIDAPRLELAAFIETVGQGRPRRSQNHVSLLVPRTVETDRDASGLFSGSKREEALSRLVEIAREAEACRRLKENPGAYGLDDRQLEKDGLPARLRERQQALVSSVARTYNRIVYPGPSGIAVGDASVAGGEGGASVAEQIRERLRADGEIVEADRAGQKETLQALAKLFFALGETPKVADIRQAFAERRRWPILETPRVLDMALRMGVEKGIWCLFRFRDPNADRPSDLHDTNDPVPMAASLDEEGWTLVALAGARKRGWVRGSKPPAEKVRGWAIEAIRDRGAARVADVVEAVRDRSGEVEPDDVLDAIKRAATVEGLHVHGPTEEPDRRPCDLRGGPEASFGTIGLDDTVLVRAEVAKRGWLDDGDHAVFVSSDEVPALRDRVRRFGRLYSKGETSTISEFAVTELELPGGGILEVVARDVSPEAMKALDEFFGAMMTAARAGAQTRVEVRIDDPAPDCTFAAEIGKDSL